MTEKDPGNQTQTVTFLRPPYIDAEGDIEPSLVASNEIPNPHYLNLFGTESDITEQLPIHKTVAGETLANIDAIFQRLILDPSEEVSFGIFLHLKDLFEGITQEPFASISYPEKIQHILELLQTRANKQYLHHQTSRGEFRYKISDILESIKEFRDLGKNFLFLQLLFEVR